MSLLLTVATFGLVLAPVAAVGHPFGPPPRAWVSVDGPIVDIGWEAAYDDHLAVGEYLGYFAEGTSQAYVDPTVQVAPPRADEEALAASDDLRDYLRSNIVVTQGSRRCEPQVLSTEAFIDRGARTSHRCPEASGPLTLRITMLHDIHEAYRTFALADDDATGPFAVFSVEEPEHTIAMEDLGAGSPGPSRLVLLGSFVVVVAGTATAFRVLTGGRRRT